MGNRPALPNCPWPAVVENSRLETRRRGARISCRLMLSSDIVVQRKFCRKPSWMTMQAGRMNDFVVRYQHPRPEIGLRLSHGNESDERPWEVTATLHGYENPGPARVHNISNKACLSTCL